MQNRVSDEVWSQLDPKAGRLTRPARRRQVVAAALALLVAVGAAATWYSGLLLPQLSVSRDGSGPEDGVVAVRLTITNDGWFPVSVAAPEPDPGPTAPGIDLLRVEGPLPTVIAPRASIELTYVYRIVDCDAVPRAVWRPAVDVARPWGAQRVTLHVGAYERPWMSLLWSDCRP